MGKGNCPNKIWRNGEVAHVEYLLKFVGWQDIRALNASDISAGNRRHDELLANSRGSGSGMACVAGPSRQPTAGSGELNVRWNSDTPIFGDWKERIPSDLP